MEQSNARGEAPSPGGGKKSEKQKEAPKQEPAKGKASEREDRR
jgi:hypothetical protein